MTAKFCLVGSAFLVKSMSHSTPSDARKNDAPRNDASLPHVNAVTSGAPTGTDWYDSTVELMNENMVYGGRQFSPMPNGATDPWNTCRNYTIDKSQLPLFHLAPWLICNRQWYWLRDVVSVTAFAHVHSFSTAHCSPASTVLGIRPVVGIY